MTSNQSPTIDLDQITNSDEWTIIDSHQKIAEFLCETWVPEHERKTICVINERTGSVLIDKVYDVHTFAGTPSLIITEYGLRIGLQPCEQKIYLYSPSDPLPTKTGSKIYNVTVQDLTESGNGITYLFDTLTQDREGRWFGLDQHGMLHILDEDYEYAKITKFSLTPNDSDN